MEYTQIKVSVDPGLAASFKVACEVSGVSMTSALSKFMASYCASATVAKSAGLDTRRQRRAAVNRLTNELTKIIVAEERYRDNIPPNLQGSSLYESADEAVSLMEEAAELLASAY